MERHFDEELRQFSNDILKMAALAEEAIRKAYESLKNQDSALAETVIREDEAVDEMELVIEEQGINLLALRQPLAADLRFIATGLRINAELERIADLAVNIAQCVHDIANQPLLKPLVDIPKLADIARRMVKESIDAFVNRNQQQAKKVILEDPEADALRDLVQKELIYEYMVKDGKTAPRAVPLLLISRHLERVCDHATNIAEDVIYMVNAQVVKHHPEKLNE